MSVEGNSIINSDGSNTVDKCNKVLNGSLEDPSHDLSYNEHILKDDNLKFLCSSSEINIKDLEHSFYNHDMKCEFLLVRYLTENEKHKQKLIKFINPTINKLNRYSNVIPYEYNSVPVSPSVKQFDMNNYINASFISGAFGTRIIAAQNPMENTLNSFWLMIINHKISFIILLSYTFEESNDKYIQYWPKETNTPITIVDPSHKDKTYTIKLSSQMIIIEKYVIMRTIDIQEGENVILTLRHYHVNFWEEHSVPLQQIGFQVIEDLIVQMAEEYEKTKNPILVHCSDGIGRTGTFLALFNIVRCLQEQKKAKIAAPFYNVFNVVRKIREERFGMVTDSNQYKYIYDFCKQWINRFYDI